MAKKLSVPVREVGRTGVQMLRPFEWVATVFQSFRDRPLPASYKTEVQPVFDIFGSERVGTFTFEVSIGVLGGLEAFGSKVPGDRYRFYYSAECFHTDIGVTHHISFSRILPDPLLGFPSIGFDSGSVFSTPSFQVFSTRNVTLQPEGRMTCRVTTMGVGARLAISALFVELPIGEPTPRFS
jgi:hypothetical protein